MQFVWRQIAVDYMRITWRNQSHIKCSELEICVDRLSTEPNCAILLFLRNNEGILLYLVGMDVYLIQAI